MKERANDNLENQNLNTKFVLRSVKCFVESISFISRKKYIAKLKFHKVFIFCYKLTRHFNLGEPLNVYVLQLRQFGGWRPNIAKFFFFFTFQRTIGLLII